LFNNSGGRVPSTGNTPDTIEQPARNAAATLLGSALSSDALDMPTGRRARPFDGGTGGSAAAFDRPGELVRSTSSVGTRRAVAVGVRNSRPRKREPYSSSNTSTRKRCGCRSCFVRGHQAAGRRLSKRGDGRSGPRRATSSMERLQGAAEASASTRAERTGPPPPEKGASADAGRPVNGTTTRSPHDQLLPAEAATHERAVDPLPGRQPRFPSPISGCSRTHQVVSTV